MKIVFNPFTGNLDFIHSPALLLDQTIPQKVDNGSPQFNEGIIIKHDKEVYLDGV